MRSLIRPLLFALAFLAALPAAGSHPWGPLSAKERQALVDLYNATNGDDWINKDGWLGPVGTECDWHGIECGCIAAACPYVDGIVLQRNNLRGRLPGSIGNLRHLWTLDLSVNRLRGELPPELGRLRRLTYLLLGLNKLSGPIPREIGSLTRLRLLSLSWNRLSGSLPAEMAGLSRLQLLGLVANQLTGEIPPWIGSLTQLQILGLSRNQLTGEIPKELFDLEFLHELGLDENHLFGRIPEGIGAHDLQMIYLQGNLLTGPIPETILDLDFLAHINVEWNALYPTSPEVEQFLIDRGGFLRWVFTQTLAPENLAVTPAGSSSVRLTWTPVNYSPGAPHAEGGYLVYAKKASLANRFRLVKVVLGKQSTSVVVDELEPATDYMFRVRGFSRPHGENKNIVRSEMTREVTVTTLPFGRGVEVP